MAEAWRRAAAGGGVHHSRDRRGTVRTLRAARWRPATRLGLGLTLALTALAGRAREYHIESQADFDALRTAAFEPGDRILFHCGRRFRGMFAPRGKGSPEAPIRILATGSGSPPRIDAGGRHPAGLLLTHPDHWEVEGLEITNTDGTDRDQGALFGILALVRGEDGVHRHLYIRDCFIHDVNGMVGGKQRGGIHVVIEGCRAARFDDLQITGNRIVNVGGVGISNASSCGRVDLGPGEVAGRNLWTRVYIAGNHVERTGRNGIIVRASRNAVCEFNLLARCSRAETGHSIFGFHCEGLRLQRNEACGNVGPEGRDRGGFDADYNCVGTVIQYNYSHDNEWFCGIMKRPNRDVTIRYNLSQNDRQGIYFYGFENARQARNIRIYHNTHFVRRGLDVRVFAMDRTPLHSRFENNVFFFEEQGQWGRNAPGIHTVFRHNLYFHIRPPAGDPDPIVADPRLERPGTAGWGIDLRTMAAVAGYVPRADSPCLEAATAIPDRGDRDLLGNPVPVGRADLGALERQPPAGGAREWACPVGRGR
ncbi:MAG: right-handed parallel beta-helix repeat-containing protein [Verrucomicrobia bacterium]|nr:MAG: right-handed parallel beta-helix repeat-containing protein [Verrucomicrobiota bacterium]